MLIINAKISRTRARQKALAWLWQIAPKPELVDRFAKVVVVGLDSKVFSFDFFYSEVAKKWLTMD